MAKGKNWIAGATANKGGLHKSLGIAQGKSIPAKAINKATQSSNPTVAKQAQLAKTLAKLRKG